MICNRKDVKMESLLKSIEFIRIVFKNKQFIELSTNWLKDLKIVKSAKHARLIYLQGLEPILSSLYTCDEMYLTIDNKKINDNFQMNWMNHEVKFFETIYNYNSIVKIVMVYKDGKEESVKVEWNKLGTFGYSICEIEDMSDKTNLNICIE